MSTIAGLACAFFFLLAWIDATMNRSDNRAPEFMLAAIVAGLIAMA